MTKENNFRLNLAVWYLAYPSLMGQGSAAAAALDNDDDSSTNKLTTWYQASRINS